MVHLVTELCASTQGSCIFLFRLIMLWWQFSFVVIVSLSLGVCFFLLQRGLLQILRLIRKDGVELDLTFQFNQERKLEEELIFLGASYGQTEISHPLMKS